MRYCERAKTGDGRIEDMPDAFSSLAQHRKKKDLVARYTHLPTLTTSGAPWICSSESDHERREHTAESGSTLQVFGDCRTKQHFAMGLGDLSRSCQTDRGINAWLNVWSPLDLQSLTVAWWMSIVRSNSSMDTERVERSSNPLGPLEATSCTCVSLPCTIPKIGSWLAESLRQDRGTFVLERK